MAYLSLDKEKILSLEKTNIDTKVKNRFFFFILLFLISGTLGYAFIFNHFINRTYKLFYLQMENPEGDTYCYENLTLNRYHFSTEEIIFTTLHNTISGPQNVFLNSGFIHPLSISKVHLFGNTLIVDFNHYLTDLTIDEEELLLTVFYSALQVNFPELEEMFWLVEGRQIRYIKSGQAYNHPLRLRSYSTNTIVPDLPTLPAC